jgi:hypothetical protein
MSRRAFYSVIVRKLQIPKIALTSVTFHLLRGLTRRAARHAGVDCKALERASRKADMAKHRELM